MSFSDSPSVVADELARRLESQPAVVATDRLSAQTSLSGRETVEATVKNTDRGTLPNAVARAVVANPKLILADEPTGNLDSTNGAQVMELLSDLNEAGTTIVMVTHSPADAEYSARTIHLFDGKVVSENFIEQEYAAHPGV